MCTPFMVRSRCEICTLFMVNDITVCDVYPILGFLFNIFFSTNYMASDVYDIFDEITVCDVYAIPRGITV